MKLKKIMALTLTCTLVATSILTGCGKTADKGEAANNSLESKTFNATGYPIVDEAITLKLAAPKTPIAPDYGQMKIMQDLAKKCNINIEWNNIPEADYVTKKNLLIASGDLPDGFWNSKFTDSDLVTYGAEGTIIPLGDLIEKYMPNLSAEMKKDPTIKSKLTAPDGKIYSLPAIEQMGLVKAPFFTAVNTKWLQKLGLSMPTTPAEFKTVLEAFKTKDPNGNGQQDEIPFSFMPNSFCADLGDLMAPFWNGR